MTVGALLATESMSESMSQRMAAARRAVALLGSRRTLADLLTHAAHDVASIGFDRVLISQIADSRWLPQCAWSAGDPAGAEAMIAVGLRARRVLDSQIIESEVVRRRSSMLVSDVQRNPRVHPELKQLNQTTAYLVAPILVEDHVIGLIHVDNFPHARAVDSVDQEALAMFATCFGCAVERVHYLERLREVGQHVTAAMTDPPSLLADPCEPMDDATGWGFRSHALTPRPEPVPASLTRRELDVLRHLVAGETNRAIAARLFISETTVKSHVKHILRKLGAANRADAVSRFLRDRAPSS